MSTHLLPDEHLQQSISTFCENFGDDFVRRCFWRLFKCWTACDRDGEAVSDREMAALLDAILEVLDSAYAARGEKG